MKKIILHTLFPFVHSASYLFVTSRCPRKKCSFIEIGALLTKEHFFWVTLYCLKYIDRRKIPSTRYETIFDFNELELGKQFPHFSCCNRHRSIFLECGHLFEYILLLHDNCLVPYVDVVSSLYRTIWYNRPNKMYCCLF